MTQAGLHSIARARLRFSFPITTMISSRIIFSGLFFLIVTAHWSTARAEEESPAQNKVIVNDPDDRLSTVPAHRWTYAHQSAQDVTNTTSSQNARIVDISVEQVSPSRTGQFRWGTTLESFN